MQTTEVHIAAAETFPATSWHQDNEPRRLVLMGHRQGVARFHATNTGPAHQLAEHHSCAVPAVEIPLRGERQRANPGRHQAVPTDAATRAIRFLADATR